MKLCGVEVGLNRPFFLIAGPCVIESLELARETAGRLKEITGELDIPFIYKSSFDKANRSSADSFRGLGLEQGLQILAQVKAELNVPVLTDVHEDTPLKEVVEVADVLQTPAFLCRQTNFIQRVAACGRPVNIKKGQFLSPGEMRHVVDKARAQGNTHVLVCERGVSFGYNNLVSDMRSLSILRETGCPVVFDATHSVQLPGAGDGRSGGQREFVSAAGPCRRGMRDLGYIHGDPSRPRSCEERWAQFVASGKNENAPAGSPGHRPDGQAAGPG